MNETQKKANTVLVVEDEVLLLDLSRMMLEASGYSVLSARDGVEALQLAANHVGPIDLLLTDLHMPRMGGCELVSEFKALFPNAKVLYMTGSSAWSCEDDLDIPAKYVLCKPVPMNEFLGRVSAALA